MGLIALKPLAARRCVGGRAGISLLSMAALAAAQGPVFRSDTRVVEVAVVARDAQDSPITDLSKSDFRLFDNGVEQTILSFDKLGASSDGNTTDSKPTDHPAPRLSIIFLDALNTHRSAQIYGQAAISEMLRGLPQGEDRIAIFALGDQLHLLHGFSMNPASLRAAVDGYEVEQPSIGAPPRPNSFSAPFSLTAPAQTMPNPDPYADLRLSLTLEAFMEIARNMKDVPGEKNLLWVTDGFPPPADHRDIEEATRELAAAKVMLYPIDARGLISCIGPCPPAVSLNIASLEEIAGQTGGRAYHDDNGLSALARAALDDSREGYVLTYAPTNYRSDGSAHTVQLKTGRKGVDLRYRPGYFAD